jgi:hypothetical protein
MIKIRLFFFMLLLVFIDVSPIMYADGINSRSYFIKNFKTGLVLKQEI